MRRALLFSVLLPCVLGAQAQPTLDECRELARGHYPEIRQYDLIRRTAEYDLSNARRAWLPQLSLSAQATWQTDVPGFPREMTGFLAGQGLEIPGLNRDQYKAQLELSQTIWDGGRSSADKRMAEAEAAEAARTADADLYALEGRVDGLYFGILLLDERIAQTRITIGLLRSDLDKVRSLLRNGAAAQSDADAVEAELLAAGSSSRRWRLRATVTDGCWNCSSAGNWATERCGVPKRRTHPSPPDRSAPNCASSMRGSTAFRRRSGW